LASAQAPVPTARRDIFISRPAEAVPDSFPRSFALVIGIAEYPKLARNNWLRFPERDAESLYSVLISQAGGGFRAENVRKLIGPAATLENMRRELEEWLPSVAQDADRVLIYFAGHGFVVDGKALLSPYDFDPARPLESGYAMDTLGKVIGTRIRSRWKVLLTDACHSGAITPDNLTINATLRDLSHSLFSLTASRDRESSFEGEYWGGGHGAFTYYVTEGLKGAADTGDGVVTADELAEYVRYNVRESVRKQAQGSQSPTFDRSSFDPDMPLSFPGVAERKAGAHEDRFGTLVFTTNQDDVEIFVDGESRGIARKGQPLSVPGLTIGSHTIKGVKMGYEPDGPREETVYPSQTTTVTIKILYPRRRDKRSSELLDKGIVEYQKGSAEHYRKAAEYFQSAWAADASYSTAALYLGRTYHVLLDLTSARKAFARALEIDPDYRETRVAYAGMLLDTGDVDECIRQLSAAGERDATDPIAAYLLAQAFRIKEEYGRSIELARKSISLAPRNPEAHFFLAESLRMTGKLDEAKSEYLQYLKLSDFNSKLAGRINYYVGGYLIGRGKKRRAAQQDVWRDLRSLALAGLGDCERVQYHPDPAIGFYREALTYDRNDPLIHYALGMALTTKAELTGRLDSLAPALVSFRQMLHLNPDLAESAMARNYIAKIEGLLDVRR
jgi:tetratricopeptide (TPR) repeat protein